MQTGTVSGLWLYGGDLEDSKSISGGTLCVFGSHTFVPISWMCKKQTSVFTQFNRIRNQLFGRWIESRRASQKTWLRLQSERRNPLWIGTKITGQTSDLKEWSTFWKIFIVFPQRPVFASRRSFVCVWGQRSIDQDDLDDYQQESHQWDMSPEPTELLLIGYSIESISTPESKSSTSTPKTNLPNQYQPFQFYSLFWSDVEKNAKIQEKNDSQQNRDQWRAFLQGFHRAYHPRLQKARGREAMGIKIPGVWERIDRGNPFSFLSLGTQFRFLIDRSKPVVNGDKDHWPNERSRGMINVLNNIPCVPSGVGPWDGGPHVHGEQSQLHRNKWHLQDFELHGWTRPELSRIQGRVHRRRTNSDDDSGKATRAWRHWGRSVSASIAPVWCVDRFMWLCERPAAVKRAAVEGGCLHLTPQFTPARLILPVVTCLSCTPAPTMILRVDDRVRWLKSLNAKQVIHVTIHAHNLSNKIGVSRHLDSSTTTHKWPKSWSNVEDPVVLLGGNLHGHPLAGLTWERQFEKILLKHGWEKIPNWECLFVHREKGLFLSVYVDDIKLAGKKQNLDPMWKVFNKEVDLGKPTLFLNHVYLGCTQRQCEIGKDIVDNAEPCLNREFLRREQKASILSESSHFFMVLWYGGSCKEMCGCIDDYHFKEDELKSIGELSHVCSQVVLKCLYLARIGRPDILWSVNKLARSITKWTKACDKRLNRLISTFISHVNANCIVMLVALLNNADCDCFKTLTSREILRIQKLHQV